MAKTNCGWMSWVWLVVGLLYLLGAWVPTAFSWWTNNFPWYGVGAFLLGLWGIVKK